MDPSDPAYPGGIVKRRVKRGPWKPRPGAEKKAREQEQAEREAEAKKKARLRDQVIAYRKERAEADEKEQAELARMTPAQQHAYFQHLQSNPRPTHPWPPGWIEAVMEVDAKERVAEEEERKAHEEAEQRELEAREKKLGLPKARKLAEREEREADTERDEALAKLNAEHEQACEAVRDRCRVKHEAARQPVKALEDQAQRIPTTNDPEQVPA